MVLTLESCWKSYSLPTIIFNSVSIKEVPVVSRRLQLFELDLLDNEIKLNI